MEISAANPQPPPPPNPPPPRYLNDEQSLKDMFLIIFFNITFVHGQNNILHPLHSDIGGSRLAIVHFTDIFMSTQVHAKTLPVPIIHLCYSYGAIR